MFCILTFGNFILRYNNLNYLGLDDNEIQNFDFTAIENLQKLTHLDLSQNYLSKFPIEKFKNFSNLEWIGLYDNLLLDIAVEKLNLNVSLHLQNNIFMCSRLLQMHNKSKIFGLPLTRKDSLKNYEKLVKNIRCIDEKKISGKDLQRLFQSITQNTEDTCSKTYYIKPKNKYRKMKLAQLLMENGSQSIFSTFNFYSLSFVFRLIYLS